MARKETEQIRCFVCRGQLRLDQKTGEKYCQTPSCAKFVPETPHA